MKKFRLALNVLLSISMFMSGFNPTLTAEAHGAEDIEVVEDDETLVSGNYCDEDEELIAVDEAEEADSESSTQKSEDDAEADEPEKDEETENTVAPDADGVKSRIVVTGGTEGVDYIKDNEGTVTVKTSTPLVLDGNGIETSTKQIILGDESVPADINVTLKDIVIAGTTLAPVKIPDDYEKNVNITLVGESTLKAGENFAGIEKNSTSANGMLTIDGEGSLTVSGGRYGAGIGGGKDGAGSNITISGGTVTAKGGYYGGAGIGGGDNGAGSNITISGGKVTATGSNGAGIGGGSLGSGSNIMISGGTVTVEGCTGIGGGLGRAGSNIMISGGTVTATGNGAGIGGTPGSNITISGGTVTATGGDRGAGIGGGSGSNITISGGTVTAIGGDRGAGIGGGEYGKASDIYIKDASVKAVGGSKASDIGSGFISDGIEELIPKNEENGNNVYLVTVPHYGNLSVQYKLHSESVWTSLSFPAHHKGYDLFYLYLIKGVYDFKLGDHRFDSVYVGPEEDNMPIVVNTRKIIIDDIIGDELVIVSNNQYTAGNHIYDCSNATDEYYLEQRSSDPVKRNVVVREVNKITVNNLNLAPVSKAAILIESKTDILLWTEEGSENTFTSPSNHAGIEKAIETGKLTLDGEGNLTVSGGSDGAGIGVGSGGDGSDITISGGTVTATGGDRGPGIGGGSGSNITISGGTVTAAGGGRGAGIGGGSGSNITISGGTVMAEGGYGSISGGTGIRGGNITISGGTVTAKGGSALEGKGGDGIYCGSGSNTISGGTVTATGGEGGAGIGGGSGSNITIDGGEVTATGGYSRLSKGEYGGAGIGGSSGEDGSNITINGGTVTATGGEGGAGIGGGKNGNGSNITICGGEVTATGKGGGAGIGGGIEKEEWIKGKGYVYTGGNGSNITISGGTVTAIGSAGIGGGSHGDGSDITISGGKVTATGSRGAGIGGGYYDGNGSNITISGGTVTATGGGSFNGKPEGAGIGGGYYGNGSNITINGGTITATDIRSEDKITISGGNIKADLSTNKLQLSSTDISKLCLVKVTGYLPGDSNPFTSIPDAEYYGLKDVVAHDDGNFYFYLPYGIDLSSYNRCRVSFDADNGTVVPDQSLNVGDKIIKPEDPIKEGYLFAGWYRTKDSTDEMEPWDFENDVVTNTDGITIYAKWKKLYTVSYDTCCEASVPSQTVEGGGKAEKPEDPVWDDHTFVGWFKVAESISYEDIWNFDTDTVTKDIILYAGWISGTAYTVSFHTGCEDFLEPQFVRAGSKVIRPTNPVWEDHVFLGWFKTAESTDEADRWVFENDEVTEDITLYAGWRDTLKYTVSFETGCEAVIPPQILEEGSKLIKPTDPEWEDYTFVGWFKVADSISYEDIWNFDKDIVTADMTLYAGWISGKAYTVSFYTGCEDSLESQLVIAGSKVTKPTDPVWEDHVFLGWFKKAGSTDEDDKWDFENDEVTEDITLYAAWEEVEKYTVSFISGCNVTVPSQSVTAGGKVNEPSEPVWKDHLFFGWYKMKDARSDQDRWYFDTDRVTSNITLYARWVPEYPMSPLPAIDSETVELHLVKGQKFALPAGTWESTDTNAVSISKKGVLTAKKIGNAELRETSGNTRIKVYVTQPKMGEKKYKLNAGSSVRIAFEYDSLNYAVAWYSSAPDIATVSDSGMVQGISKGVATVTAFVNGKEYKCKVAVAEPAAAYERTLHMNVNAQKAIKLKGIKNAIWKSGDISVAEVSSKGKIIAKAVGETILTTVYYGKEYRIYLYVEDIHIKAKNLFENKTNKYTMNINSGDSIKLVFSKLYQQPMFKSSKSEYAFVTSDGIVKAMKTGKTKLTGKINGKTITITVNVY